MMLALYPRRQPTATVYDPKGSGTTTLLSADGITLLTDKDAILERWTEHFNSVLNRPSSVI